MVVCLERGADLHMAQLVPLPLTVSCFNKIQIGFAFLVPAHPGSPREKGVKRVCVCVCTLSSLILTEFLRPRRHLSATLRNAVNGHKLRELRRTPRVCSCALHSPTSPTAHAVLLCYHAEKAAALHFLSLNCLIILRSN